MAQTPVVENNYVGDGVTQAFALTWPYLNPTEVFVSVNGVNVSFAWLAGSSSTVQTTVAPAAGSAVRVYRNTRAVEPLHKFSAGVPFLPRYVDENADQLLYALQEGVADFQGVVDAAELVASRSVRVGPSEPVLPVLPAVADRAGKLLSFDTSGNPIAVAASVGSAEALGIALAGSEGVKLVGNAADKRDVAATVALLQDSDVALAPTRLALRSLSVTRANKLAYLAEGRRAGLFVSVAGSMPVADPNEAIYILSSNTGYYWSRVGASEVNFLWCGADTSYTSTTDNWAAWIQAIRFCGATGMPLYVPAGRYGFVNAPQIDMSEFKASGMVIYGDGHARSILDFRSVLTSPNMQIFGSPTTAAPFSDTYYLNLRDIGMIGNIGAALGAPGYILQLGKDDLSDPPNLYNWEGVGVQNFDTTDQSRAVKMNYVVGSKFDVQFNCGSGGTGNVGGKGIALTMRNCGFNQFFGSIGSAGIAIQMEDLYNYGNQFNCMDMENVAICVRTLGTLNQSNTWIGGRWAYFTAGFDAQKGTSNLVINPDIGAGGSATLTGFVAAKTGLEVIGARGRYPLTTPAMAGSGVDVVNPNARKVTVGIFGGTVQQIRVNGQVYNGLTGGFVPLNPEDTIGITYSAAPTWIWRT